MSLVPRFNAKKLRLEALEARQMLSADAGALAADLASFAQTDAPALVSNAQTDDAVSLDLTDADADANKTAAPKFAVVSAGNPSRTTVRRGGSFQLVGSSFRNDGDATAPVYWLNVYASVDATLSTDDALLTRTLVANAVPSGATVRLATTIGYPTNVLDPGDYYIVWEVSAGEGATATSATAVCAKTLTVEGNAIGEGGAPDLKSFNGGWATKYSLVQGESFDFATGWVANVGAGPASAGYKVTLYASTDETITADDAPLATIDSTKALNRFEGTTFRFTDVSTAGLDAGASYYIGWIVSDVDGESEAATENNVGRCAVKLTVDANEPDLKAFDGGCLSTYRLNVGETFDLKTGLVSNVGKGGADAGYKVAVFASLDRTLSDDDVRIGTLDATPALNRFGATTFSLDDLATDVLRAGESYYIGWAITDVARETNETNNAAFCPIELTLNADPGVAPVDPRADGANVAAVGSAYCDNYKSVVRGLQVLCKSGYAEAGYKLTVYATKKSSFSPATSVVIAETDDTQALRTGQSASYNLDISTSSLKKGTYKLFWTITDVDGETKLGDNIGRFMNDLVVQY